MPDWRQLVAGRLSGLGLDPASVADIEKELAGHLEDAYDEYLRQGASPSDALNRALADVPDWALLARRIAQARLEEGTMVSRVTQMWIPGLSALAVSTVLLQLTTRFRAVQQVPWLDAQTPILLYGQWLLALPLIGGLSAYWSKLAGGSVAARLTAALFPVTALVGALFVIVPGAILVQRPFPLVEWLLGVPAHFVGWVIIPSAALLMGAWPFLGTVANGRRQVN